MTASASAPRGARKLGIATAFSLPAPRSADELLTQREAASVLKVSVAYLRASSCPKLLLPGSGPKGKPLVRYLRSDVLSWALARRT